MPKISKLTWHKQIDELIYFIQSAFPHNFEWSTFAMLIEKNLQNKLQPVF